MGSGSRLIRFSRMHRAIEVDRGQRGIAGTLGSVARVGNPYQMNCTMARDRSRSPLPARVCTTLLLLAAAACARPGEPVGERGGRPAIETQSDTAVLRAFSDSVSGSVVATYTNRTSAPVYLGRCGTSRHPGVVLDKEIEGAWSLSYDPVCAMIGAPPLEVRPGESRTDTLPLWDYRLPHSYPNFKSPEIPGTYRIVYEVYDCCSTPPGGGVRFGPPLPREGQVSEAFRIEVRE